MGRFAVLGGVLGVCAALGSQRAGPGLALTGGMGVLAVLLHALEISRLTLDEHGLTVRRLGGHDRIAWGALRDVEIASGRYGTSWIVLRCHGGRQLVLPDAYLVPLSEVAAAILGGRRAHARSVDGDSP
jgi:hypothetical protein